MEADSREFCASCGVILRDVFFRCQKCGKLNCMECRNDLDKCCIECEPKSPAVRRKASKCSSCGERLSDESYECQQCGKLFCLDCWDDDSNCCNECADGLGDDKRKPNPAFMRPMQVDEVLGAVVGMKSIPRTEITKKLWDYIKKNGLQDKVNRRMINADDRLREVFGGKRQVSMFEMTKLVSKHMK
jgi:upstream activation factor subunit UAF30